MNAFILCGGKATRFNNGKPRPIKTLIKQILFAINLFKN